MSKLICPCGKPMLRDFFGVCRECYDKWVRKNVVIGGNVIFAPFKGVQTVFKWGEK